MPHSKEKLLHDGLVAGRELLAFADGKSLKDFESDRGLQLIVEREFEIIGEALARLRKLDEGVFQGITHGHRIIGTRNILAHGYDMVEHVILWDAIREDIPQLLSELESLL